MAELKEVISLSGKVIKVVYHQPHNGYMVMQIHAQEPNESKVIVVGYFKNISVDEEITFQGYWQQHPTHGQQFCAKNFEKLEKNISSEKFLIHHIAGIGPSFAQRLQQAFGENLKEILDKNPERIKDVPGIGKMRYEKIMQSWQIHQSSHDVILLLTSAGLSNSQAAKIVKHYGDETAEVINQNPYRLFEEIEGIGFAQVDKLALHLNVPENSQFRLMAGMLHILQQETRFGHCGMAIEKLILQSSQLLKISQPELTLMIETLVVQNKVKRDTLKEQDCLFMPTLWQQERYISVKIKKLLARPKEETTTFLKILREIEQTQTLSKEQYAAIEQTLTSPVFVLTGGPGVGKTTSVNALVEIFKRSLLQIALAAPTGRAAKRLSEATKFPAKTIHRLLEYDSFTRKFNYDKYFPLPIDVLIIDEASMLDVSLCAHLLEALPDHAKLIFVGDVHQLSSVGPGEVLRSLIESNQVPFFALKTIFRQEMTSQIIINAHRVNQGLLPEKELKEQQDFYCIPIKNDRDCLNKITTIISERLPHRFGFLPSDIQVISPMNIGVLGVNNLNQVLQQALNPQSDEKSQIKHYGGVLRENDKIIQLVNNYEKNVFNGDIGRIKSIDTQSKTVKIDFDQQIVDYQLKELSEMQLAYAITVHKAQGSEYKAVIIVLSMSQKTMLKRNLLYTAITRGKNCVVLLSEQSALVLAINSCDTATRINKLEDWLRDEKISIS